MSRHSTLYDDDFHAWAEIQAAELRKLAARPELSNVMDWDNLIEEVETLGRSDLRAAEGYLTQCLAHLIKIVSAPDAVVAEKWSKEVTLLQGHFHRAYAASMRRKFGMNSVWASAIANAEVGLWPEGLRPSRSLPAECPFEIDAFLDGFSTDACLKILSDSMKASTRKSGH